MKFSEHGLNLLKEWEGCILHIYKDAAGLPTIGIGHLLTKEEKIGNKYANGITEEEALQILAKDVVPAENAVNSHVSVQLSQNQFDALVSFTFNCGVGAFANSTLLKVLNAGNYNEVPAQLMRWTKAGGKTCDGLVTRRKNECNLWNGKI